MTAEEMSFGEIRMATRLLASDGPTATWFRNHAVGRVFEPELMRLRAILDRAPTDSTAAGQLASLIEHADIQHDQAVRFCLGVLSNAESNHPDATIRTMARDLQDLLFPEGTALTKKTPDEEIARCLARGALRTPDVRFKLARFFIPTATGPAIDLDRHMEEDLDTKAMRLADLLARRSRAEMAPNTPPLNELFAAKKQFIALMGQMFTAFKAVEADMTAGDGIRLTSIRDQWKDGVRTASRRRQNVAMGVPHDSFTPYPSPPPPTPPSPAPTPPSPAPARPAAPAPARPADTKKAPPP